MDKKEKGSVEDIKTFFTMLEKAASHCPDNVWIFVANGSLHIMLKDDDGNRVMTPFGCYDPSAIIASVDIEADGGDW